jgi:hypothetical protein
MTFYMILQQLIQIYNLKIMAAVNLCIRIKGNKQLQMLCVL